MKDKVSEESKVNCDFFSKNTTNLVFGETLEKVEIYLLFSFSLAINFQTCHCTLSSLAWTIIFSSKSFILKKELAVAGIKSASLSYFVVL